MDSLTACPPWLRTDAQALLARAADGRMPHAVLITGIDGIGKRAFGLSLAQSLLCLNRSADGGCGQCTSCAQLLADAHPEYRQLQPEGANAVIKVDAVRELVTWLQLTAGQHSFRVALIEQADRMNRNAANSLLKTLEEPGDNAVLILVADRGSALPATVRSRCQTITLRLHDKPAAEAWLAEQLSATDADPAAMLASARGGPYACLQQADAEYQALQQLLLKAWTDLFLHKGSVGRITDSLVELPTTLCLSTFSHWASLAVRHGNGLAIGAEPAVLQAISETQPRLETENWFALHDRLLVLHRSDSASFKTQTVLEGLLADIRLMIRD